MRKKKTAKQPPKPCLTAKTTVAPIKRKKGDHSKSGESGPTSRKPTEGGAMGSKKKHRKRQTTRKPKTWRNHKEKKKRSKNLNGRVGKKKQR